MDIILCTGILIFSGFLLGEAAEKINLPNVSVKTKKIAAGGLIPQGGIVIGLALLLTKDAAFAQIASFIIGIVIGATLIHEIIGPIISKYSLKKAEEID